MGGRLTVKSKENCGSTFTFVLPYKVASRREHSDDTDEDSSISDSEVMTDTTPDEINGSFIFKPRTLGTLFSSDDSVKVKTNMLCNNVVEPLSSQNGMSEVSDSFSSNSCLSRETASADGFSSVNSCNNLGSPRQELQVAYRSSESLNRRKCLDDDSCSVNSSRTQSTRSSEYGATRCSGDSHTSVSNGHRHGTAEFRNTSNESIEEKKGSAAPKILLVEDNKINIMVAQSMMKQLGHSAVIASNGLEAIRAVQRSQYDLILMVIFQYDS